MDKRIGFWLYQSCGNQGIVGRVSVLVLRWCGWCKWVVDAGLGKGLGKGGVVLWLCEFGLFVYMAGPGICILS